MTIIEDKKEQMNKSRENGYKYLSYTYSTLQELKEQKEAFAVAHEESMAKWFDTDIVTEDELYTCCIYDLEVVEGKMVVALKKGSTAEIARDKATLELSERLLRDKIDYHIDYNSVVTLARNKDILIGEQLKTWLAENNLSQNKAAELCAVTDRTFRRWVAGKPPMPKGMWELLRIKANNKEKKMTNPHANYKPNITITCPGGMEAQFLRRQGDELYWRGQMPYGMETAAGTVHRYTLVTDLQGKEIRTEE